MGFLGLGDPGGGNKKRLLPRCQKKKRVGKEKKMGRKGMVRAKKKKNHTEAGRGRDAPIWGAMGGDHTQKTGQKNVGWTVGGGKKKSNPMLFRRGAHERVGERVKTL